MIADRVKIVLDKAKLAFSNFMVYKKLRFENQIKQILFILSHAHIIEKFK